MTEDAATRAMMKIIIRKSAAAGKIIILIYLPYWKFCI